MKILLIFAAVLAFGSCYDSYRNYKLYDVTPNEIQHAALAAWEHIPGIDFFRLTAPGRTSNVLVAPERVEDFEIFLSRNNIVHEVIIADYEVELEKERAQIAKDRKTRTGYSRASGVDFGLYWTLQEMDDYMDYLADTFPTLVEMEILGFTPEGRRVVALKVSRGNFGDRPIIGMETGMHAREWAAPPSTFYLLHKLLEDQATSAELLANVDWLIVPMQNPDGYVWSWNQNRMWRQNRRQITPTCIGADLNRNFAFSWRPATAQQLCGSLTYPGPSALSEPEDFYLHELFARYRGRVVIYLSVHTFGDLMLYPWGYADSGGPIHNRDDHFRVGEIWSQSITQAGGPDILTVNSLTFFGNINGSVDDHMNGVNNSTFTFTVELTSGFNFLYPEDRVQALVEDTFNGYRALGVYVGANYT